MSTAITGSCSLKLQVGIKFHVLYSQIRDFITYILKACFAEEYNQICSAALDAKLSCMLTVAGL